MKPISMRQARWIVINKLVQVERKIHGEEWETITMKDAMGYEKMEDKMTEEKIISFDDFCDWHTANDTDRVPQEKLSEAYDVYMQLFVEGGKEYADEKITGHPIWNS